MYLLDDQDIDEDLRSIYKARNPLTTKNLTSSPGEYCEAFILVMGECLSNGIIVFIDSRVLSVANAVYYSAC